MPDSHSKILVVDDLPEKLLAYRTVLETLGQPIVEARSGEEALACLLRDDFAVILLDVNMPGMNGLETAAYVRKRKRCAHTPIIFLTSFADEVRVADGYAHGAVDYILTPVVPEVLQAKVRVFVDLHQMALQVRRQAVEQVILAEERSKRAAAELSGRQHRFLSDVSRVLADSLDPDTTAQTLVRQAVPFLADYASVTLAGDPGPTEKAWRPPEGGEVRTRRLDNAPGSRNVLASIVDRVFQTGRAEYLESLDLPYPESLNCRLTAAAVMPLLARNRTLGVLSLAYGLSGRRLETGDRDLVEDYALRAAVALDNARLHHAVQLADQQKNEFLSMLAHELRNPLAPIRNAVEALQRNGIEGANARQTTDMIGRQVAHLVRLVDDLLDVSRITQGKVRLQLQGVDLRDVLAQAVEASRPLIDRGRHRLELDLPDEAVPLIGDPTRLGQVFTNLLNNAAKYMDDGGRIRLGVRCDGEQVVATIRDSGIGIPAEMLGRVFDLFTQVDRSIDRSYGGLGIGLTLVQRLIHMHNGSVTVRSDGPNRGSEFEVRLPIHRSVTLSRRPQEKVHPTAGRLRVLVVDDNVDSAESLAVLLRLHDHTVSVAHSGPAALEAALTSPPDVAVLDIGLPGMDGFALAQQLRSRPETRDAVLVAVTGYGREEDRTMSREAGLDHHFVKPLHFDSLQQVLASVTSRSLDYIDAEMSRAPEGDRFLSPAEARM